MTTLTLANHMEAWLESRHDHVRDIDNEYYRWKNHVKPAAFANKGLHLVRAVDIKDFVRELSKTRSEQTVRHVLRQVKQAFADAQERELCSSNPAMSVKVPKQATTEDAWTYLQPEEIAALRTSPALDKHERRGALLAIFTGLRRGELLHLHWEDVVLDGPRPHITVRYSNGKAPKSGAPGQTVLLPMAAEILREMASEAPGEPSGLVFVSPKGGGAYAKGHDFGWRDRKDNDGNLRPGAKTRAGISRHVRFHDLRHTAAAALVTGYWGEPWSFEEVRDFMRHSDVKMTQRYAHLDPSRLYKKAANMSADRLDSMVAEG